MFLKKYSEIAMSDLSQTDKDKEIQKIA